MKKVISLLLILFMCFALSACNSSQNAETTETTGYTVSEESNAAKEESSSTQQDENGDTVKNMEDYDVIFLGYPIWWSDMPMAVYTFLESYDFSGKTIIPFCTLEGSGLSSTDSSIAEICTGADVLDGLEMRGSVAQNSQDEALTAVTDWLDKIEILDEN